MKAIVMHATGGPDVLRLEDVPRPSPDAAEVLVRCEAIGVNFRETQVRAGIVGGPVTGPLILGNEVAGTVEAVGDGVDRAMVGRQVVALTAGTGAYAEYVTARAQDTVAIPEGVAAEEAVAVAVQGTTALGVLRMAGITPGDTVLVEAASAGVGGYLMQLVRECRHGPVIGTAGSAAKCGRVLKQGADAVVDHTTAGWPAKVAEALGGRTLDVALEAIGGHTAREVFGLLTPASGRMVLYGRSSGQWPAITAEQVFFRGVTLSGFGGEGWAPNANGDLRGILARVADGRVWPFIEEVLSLADAAEAHKRIDQRTAMGKLVLTP